MNITHNEMSVLDAIATSEYQDGEARANQHVWTDYINPFQKRSSMPGVVASLVKKGLVKIYRGSTSVTGQDPSTIALTEVGLAAWRKEDSASFDNGSQ